MAGIARRPAIIRHPQYTHLRIDLSEIDETISVVANVVMPMLTAQPWKRVGLVNNAAIGGQLGPTERLDARALAKIYVVNVSTPIHLMGVFVKCASPGTALRIVNVSSGAAVRAFPGLSAYGSSKAALRMAGKVLGSELDSPQRAQSIDASILSYEPGTVDTEMQTETRNTPADQFPWVQIFKDFKANKQLVTADKPAADIVVWLASDGQPRFSERRFGQS